MARVHRALLAAAAAALALAALAAGQEPAADDELQDEEGDSAPFVVEVRHADGRVCGAALVSPRTALSSAACARPRAPGAVWAAPLGAGAGAGNATLVLRVAYALPSDFEKGEEAAGGPWAGAAADAALLELAAAPAGAAAVLMAAAGAECAAPARCHAARALRRPRARGAARLRVVGARLAPPAECAARDERWPARALCLAGPRLCQSDRGTGFVCAGKLCGVLSRSAGGGGAGAGGGGGAGCGDTHAAVSVPRLRRFLHCAHTRGACGRDGDCAQLCKENWLVDLPADSSDAPLTSPVSPVGAAPAPAPGASPLRLLTETRGAPTRTIQTTARLETKNATESLASIPTRTESAPTAEAAASPPATAASHRPAFEFEPNRADFKMSPARTTCVFLKAGEYGDNAADYSAPEDGPAPPAPPAPPARTAAPPARATAPDSVAARVSPLTVRGIRRPSSIRAATAAPARPLSFFIFLMYLCLLI